MTSDVLSLVGMILIYALGTNLIQHYSSQSFVSALASRVPPPYLEYNGDSDPPEADPDDESGDDEDEPEPDDPYDDPVLKAHNKIYGSGYSTN